MDHSAASFAAHAERVAHVDQPRSLNEHAVDVEELHAQTVSGWYGAVKAVLDRLLALPLLLAAAPVILTAALLIRLTSRGPAFYRQARLGKNSRPFTVIKLRTMIDGAEDDTGPVWADIDDPRITTVGRFLRRTHLDELPQLINVLLGQMSLIGPRPERPELVDRLQWDLKYYSLRNSIRPGITGIAQLRLPPDRELDCVRRKLIYDLYYIRHRGLWLDFRILAATAARFTVDLVATLCRPLWLPGWKQALDEAPLELADEEQLTVDS